MVYGNVLGRRQHLIVQGYFMEVLRMQNALS